MDTKPTNASDAYRAARERLDQRLNALNRLVREHAKQQKTEPRNWGFAGELNHAVASLNDLIEFLGGAKETRA